MFPDRRWVILQSYSQSVTCFVGSTTRFLPSMKTQAGVSWRSKQIKEHQMRFHDENCDREAWFLYHLCTLLRDIQFILRKLNTAEGKGHKEVKPFVTLSGWTNTSTYLLGRKSFIVCESLWPVHQWSRSTALSSIFSPEMCSQDCRKWILVILQLLRASTEIFFKLKSWVAWSTLLFFSGRSFQTFLQVPGSKCIKSGPNLLQ